ncbi:cytochrome P450 [Fistulina hepatica ATCC 64428]|uniref:Cytochrome P450 n=1 Tax=Fistulina hepatica ATCC 64428 TaxID=1128425 RepID=A0A0D7AER3_9AGAR|nr:cytochrome P450 [Fistulina hepatica ATCC 64428]
MPYLYLVTIPAAIVFLYAALYLYRDLSSGLQDLHGPNNSNWLLGHLLKMFRTDPSWTETSSRWMQQYGPTFKYHSVFGQQQLFTADPKAIRHILNSDHIYTKPESARYLLLQVFGRGLPVTEGDEHKNQRRVLNPAFGPSAIRGHTKIFAEYASKLRDTWLDKLSKTGADSTEVDVVSWFGRLTLDVIGAAGFNYEFNALKGDVSELKEAYSTVFKSWPAYRLRAFIPAFRILPMNEGAEFVSARETLDHLGRQFLHDAQVSASQRGEAEEKTGKARDLLSLLVRANTAPDIHASMRMSDADVISQVPTFILAAHETTSIGITWTLFALTQHLEVQGKLRDELVNVKVDCPTMDELNALPYLDRVVRESLRVYSPVCNTARIADADDVIPLSRPIVDKRGVQRHEIRIKRGLNIQIPIQIMNKDPDMWGDDAKEFRPDRWLVPPEGAKTMPGVWGNQMTFLGGPHSCIGYRFALTEIKIALFVLLRAFKFETTLRDEDLMRKHTMTQQPVLRSAPQSGSQLPLIIRPIAH